MLNNNFDQNLDLKISFHWQNNKVLKIVDMIPWVMTEWGYLLNIAVIFHWLIVWTIKRREHFNLEDRFKHYYNIIKNYATQTYVRQDKPLTSNQILDDTELVVRRIKLHIHIQFYDQVLGLL